MIRRLVAAALAAAYVAHVRHLTERAWDSHVTDALDVANPGWREVRAAFADADATWDEPTPEFAAVEALFARIDAEVAAALPELLRAVETVEDFLYAAGGD